MSTSFLQTKLIAPQTISSRVKRLKLEAQLTKVLDPTYTLALVCAPAGFGKTTLVNHWLLAQKHPSAWLSLDEGDNEPLRFWSYLLAAINKLQEDIATEAQEILETSQDYKVALTVLLNSLANLKSPAILVLDDYHLISNKQLHEGISFLLEHLPKQLKLVFTSRSEPPLPLGRLRVRGQLLELGALELSFTTNETTDFLNNVMNLGLSAKDIEALVARTEGWVASLQLVALSIQREDNPQNFIEAFTGSDKYILDYLVQEVLARQGYQMQEFLLQTSVLKCLSGPLCEFVTGFDNATELLLKANQVNLFLIPLDNSRKWFRYHHLFAEFLQQRLRESRPELFPELNSRASSWFEKQGFIDNAVQHVLLGGDMERAVELLETHSKHMLWKRDERPTLKYWLDSLPQEVIRASPRLCLDYAWLYFAKPTAKNWLEDAERLLISLEGAKAALMRGEIAILYSEKAIDQGDISSALNFFEQAMQLIPSNETYMRGFAMQSKGYALLVNGSVAEAEEVLNKASELCSTAENFVGKVAALTDLAEVYKLQGYLGKAERTLQETLLFASQNRTQSAHISCTTLVRLADVLYEQNHLNKALKYVQEGLKLAQLAGYTKVEAHACLVLAKLLQVQNNIEESKQQIQLITNNVLDDWRGKRLEAQCMHLRLEQGQITIASQWANEFAGNNHHEQILLAIARIRSAEGDTKASLSHLEHLLSNAKQEGRRGRMIEIYALQALAFAKQGKEEQALKTLQNALTLAENEKYVRIFVDEGDAMCQLLQKALSQGITPTYTSTLLKAFANSNFKKSSLNSLLTQRELEILTLIANGFSNKDIAKKLIRSLGTVKVHTSNIYSKLGAKNRTEAVARARELGLL